jgi:hypothetical protein
VHLHSLDGVDHVIGNNDRVSFLMCEHMIAIANIKLSQPIDDVVLELGYKILSVVVNK